MSIEMIITSIVFCVIGSAFFSAAEMAFSSCNRIRLENMADEGNEKAAKAFRITENYDDALSAILVGNNLVNIAASSLGSLLVMRLLSEDYAWVSTLVLTVIVIIFGETIPKITSKKNATGFSMAFAGFTHFLMVVLKPLTWIVLALTELLTHSLKGEKNDDDDAAVEELHTIIETAEDENVLDEDSSELISNAIDFSDISVSEVMTARVDIIALDIDDDREELLDIIGSSPYSRIPVYEDSIDNIIGILSVNHFLKAMIDDRDVDIRSLLMQPYFVYKTTKLPLVLSMLKDSQQHLAIVTDEYGGTFGIVSMEDVLEELVGEIWDETDTVEDDIRVISEDTFEIDGDSSVFDLIDLMNWDEDAFDYESETVGGWCIEMLEGFPNPGDSFRYRNAEVFVSETEERRVTKAMVRIIPDEESSHG
ncbi:MAG: hemolysin family protein [Solobacterium sp.]|nr:hemolysin family protein [Solobacterium sp.]